MMYTIRLYSQCNITATNIVHSAIVVCTWIIPTACEFQFRASYTLNCLFCFFFFLRSFIRSERYSIGTTTNMHITLKVVCIDAYVDTVFGEIKLQKKKKNAHRVVLLDGRPIHIEIARSPRVRIACSCCIYVAGYWIGRHLNKIK